MTWSQPHHRVEVDGIVHGTLSCVVDEPDGGAGGTVAITFASRDVTLTPTSHLTVHCGFKGDRTMGLVFDSARLDSNQLQITPDGDTLKAVWRSKLDANRDLAPSTREVWRNEKSGLRGLMQYVGRKLGYSAVVSNIENIPLPREIRIEPTESYWEILGRFLDPMAPYVLPDDLRGTLYIWALDIAIPGGGMRLPFRLSEGVDLEKVIRKIVNQALLRYIATGRDGRGGGDWNCGGVTTSYTSSRGRLIRTSRETCGDEHVTLDATADGIEIDEYREQGQNDEYQLVRDYYYKLSDGREINFSTEITAYAIFDDTAEKVGYQRMYYFFLGGTNWEETTGHTVHYEGLCDRPGKGREWVDDLKDETEWSTLGQFDDTGDVWHKLYTERIVTGRYVWPEMVPLETAHAAEFVDTSPETYQEDRSGQLLRRVERVRQVGTSRLKHTWIELDYLKDKRRFGGSSESIGRQPGKDDKTEPTEELYQDEGSIATYGAQKAETIDGTWIGSDVEPLLGQGASSVTGREWCVRMADAMFRRSGKRVAKYTSTIARPIVSLNRGAKAFATRRGGANAHDYVITGFRLSAETDGESAETVYQTIVTGRRLDRLDAD